MSVGRCSGQELRDDTCRLPATALLAEAIRRAGTCRDRGSACACLLARERGSAASFERDLPLDRSAPRFTRHLGSLTRAPGTHASMARRRRPPTCVARSCRAATLANADDPAVGDTPRLSRHSGLRAQADTIGEVARSSRPEATLARCCSISSNVASPAEIRRSRT
jgi:hypothetical protein